MFWSSSHGALAANIDGADSKTANIQPDGQTPLFISLHSSVCLQLHAEEPNLSADEQARLAQQFAPVLVFHSAEKFFPASPLFSFDTTVRISDKETTLRRLGTTESRTAAYLELNLAERAKLATVHYRAYPARRDGRGVVVLEYWFYYVRDEYRVRGNILPIWAGGNHPNDLEHVHLVLRQEEPGKFVVDEILASAHEGKIPANRYKYGKAVHDGPTHYPRRTGFACAGARHRRGWNFHIGHRRRLRLETAMGHSRSGVHLAAVSQQLHESAIQRECGHFRGRKRC